LREPRRISDLGELRDYVRVRVEKIIECMKQRGWDSVVVETYRTQQRQDWLYGIGRIHDLKRKPVTWTHHSKHSIRKAVDFIDRRFGYANSKFYSVLAECARAEGMYTIPQEGCHIEWQG